MAEIDAEIDDERLDKIELRPGQEPLTAEEKEEFLRQARAEGRSLSSEEQYAIFGPAPEKVEAFRQKAEVVEEMESAYLDAQRIAQLEANFFPELGDGSTPVAADLRLVRGVILDFEETLATLPQPLDQLMIAGAQDAEAYMRSTGMTLPAEFWDKIVEARRFAQEKSEEEREEHLADDAMSFLLQFFGYPASKLDREVLRRTVDIFYAREMVAWQLRPGAKKLLQTLNDQGYKLALMTNYNSDRTFQRIVDYLGIRHYFDLVVTSASIEYRKPDVTFFQAALDRWDALPYEVVVVGDSLKLDITGGLELGALTVQVNLGSTPQVEHDNALLAASVKPDAVVEDLTVIADLVEQWANPDK